jgi:hypothetical protein
MIQKLIALVLILFLVVGLEQILINIHEGRNCNREIINSNKDCAFTLYNKISLANLIGNARAVHISDGIAVFSTLIWAIGLLIVRYYLEKMQYFLSK